MGITVQYKNKNIDAVQTELECGVWGCEEIRKDLNGLKEKISSIEIGSIDAEASQLLKTDIDAILSKVDSLIQIGEAGKTALAKVAEEDEVE